MSERSAAGSIRQSESIIVFPTKCTRPASIPSRSQVLRRLWAVREAPRREPVGQDTVQLFRHGLVEAAQSRLEVCDGDLQLRRGERSRERRVDIAGHEQDVGPLGEQDLLDPLQGARGLGAVRARADTEHVVGLGHAERLDEDLGHLAVVVLARVHEHVPRLRKLLPQGMQHGRELHEVGPRTREVGERQGGGSGHHRSGGLTRNTLGADRRPSHDRRDRLEEASSPNG